MQRRKDSKNRVLKEGEYERPNGTYEYRWRDKRGKRHAVYSKSLKELREKETEVVKDIIDGINIDRRKITVNDLYDKWVQLKRGIKDNTFEQYKYVYEHYVKNSFGELKIENIRKTDVKAFYNDLIDKKSLKSSSVTVISQILRQVLEIGIEDGYIRTNPISGALRDLQKEREDKKKKALTVEEQKIFERFLLREREKKWRAIFMIMLYTGMRVGETTSLRWCDIDLENSLISINHTTASFPYVTDTHKIVTINTPKTKSGERTIPMLPIVKEMFLSEKRFQEEIGLTCVSEIDGYTDFIFLNSGGRVQTKYNLNKALIRIVNSCNKEQGRDLLPHISCHCLRHTFATRMCEAGLNIKAIQEILGHTDIKTTMNIYAEATKELKVSEMSKLEKFFSET